MTELTNEEQQLRSVTLQNTRSIFMARRRAEEELVRTKEDLEQRTRELAESLAKLQRREQELADFFENATVGLHWVGPDGIILRVNHAELQMLGYTRDEYVGHHIAEFHVDRDVIAKILERLAKGDTIRECESRMRCKDGSIRNVLIDSSVMWEDGEFVHTRCFTRDITDRRRSEEVRARLAAIVESSDDAILAKTLGSRILSWNAGAERLFGYTAEEAIGQSIMLILPEKRQEEERLILERLARGECLDHFETVRVAKDGRRIDVSLSVSPIRDEMNRVVAASVIARDVSNRRRAEQRLAAQYGVSRALAESSTLEEAATRVLQTICEHLEWEVGALWYVDSQHELLRCSQVWHRPSTRIPRFEAICHQFTFRHGVGLPGRVWSSRQATWVPDVVHDDNFPRAPFATAEGLHGAFGFPIALEREVLGVIEFFSPEIRPPDQDVLEMMTAVGSQLGQFIERKRAEEALRQSEQRLRLLAETVPSIIWAAAPDGTITYANERWLGYCGWTPQESAPWAEPVLHPEDQPRWAEVWTAARDRGVEVEIEMRHRRRDGVYRWFVTRAVPLRDADGEIIQWFGTSSDIDDRKRSEQTSRFLADASITLAELTDYESTLRRVAALAVPLFADWCAVDMESDGSLQRLAVTHTDPRKAEAAHELFRRYPPRPSDRHGIGKVLRTGQPEWLPTISDSLLTEAARDEDQLLMLRELGLLSALCVPLRSRGRTIGAMTFVTAESGRVYDATSLAAAEDLAYRAVIAIENAQLLERLREADRRKDEFLAMLAHELRNPLAPIRNAAQVFRAKAAPTPELLWSTEVIERQVQQMSRLIDDLLDVSRISRGKITLHREPIDLATVVSTAVESSRSLIEKWGHHLTVVMPPEPIRVDADSTRLAQVFLNLLNNAAKYTDQGGRIELVVEREPEQVLIRVRDTGIGIPPDMLSRIFDMFTQVDRSIERSEGGLGIGLTLVQRLVELHGGTVRARSDGPGKGSEFLVWLPHAPGLAEDRSSSEIPSAVSAASRRILVVDDNSDASDTLGLLLRLMGHEVQTAHDGLEALGAAATFRPEVVLLDLGLPKLTGYEVARRIRQQEGGERVVLIAVTGWGQDEDRRRSKEAGFDHHMTKPVEFAALQGVLGEVAAGRAQPAS